MIEFNAPTTLEWLVLIGGAAYGLRQIWKYFISPTVTAISTLMNVAPTLQVIATEFRPNSGESLYDVIHEMREDIRELKARATGLEDEVFPTETSGIDNIVDKVVARLKERDGA